jgi:hypothetical protein
MAEWSEDHVTAIGSLNLDLGIFGRICLIGDRAGPLGRKWRPLVGKIGEWYVKSRYLQGCSPHLCRLRTDGLAPTSKY